MKNSSKIATDTVEDTDVFDVQTIQSAGAALNLKQRIVLKLLADAIVASLKLRLGVRFWTERPRENSKPRFFYEGFIPELILLKLEAHAPTVVALIDTASHLSGRLYEDGSCFWWMIFDSFLEKLATQQPGAPSWHLALLMYTTMLHHSQEIVADEQAHRCSTADSIRELLGLGPAHRPWTSSGERYEELRNAETQYFKAHQRLLRGE